MYCMNITKENKVGKLNTNNIARLNNIAELIFPKHMHVLLNALQQNYNNSNLLKHNFCSFVQRIFFLMGVLGNTSFFVFLKRTICLRVILPLYHIQKGRLSLIDG